MVSVLWSVTWLTFVPVVYCCISYYPQTQWLKTADVCHLPASVAQQSRARTPGSPALCSSRFGQWLQSSQGSAGARSASRLFPWLAAGPRGRGSKLVHLAIGRLHLPTPWAPAPGCLAIWQLAFPRVK